MSSKLNTNGVLTNGLDYFCLVCECWLHHESDAIAHVEKPVHMKKINETDYFDKENYVRKINKWYFCELCSLVLATAARVRLHVADQQHTENKRTRILQRMGTTVVAFSCVQIDDKAWHGIMDETCVICNTEFDDENIHINQTSHIIKFIQNRIEFDSNRNIFRKVDESSVHCITCNVIIGLNTLDIHFNETEHKNFYLRCCDAYKTTIKKGALEKTEACESEKGNDNDKLNEINNVKTSETSIEVDDGKTKTLHFAEFDDKEICEIMNANNYVITNTEGKFHCLLCDWKLNCDINSHINDFHHQTLLGLHKDRLTKLGTSKNLAAAPRDVKSKEDAKPITKNKLEVQDRKDNRSEPKKDEEEDIENYIKQNNMTKHAHENKVYCMKCDSNIPYSLISLKEHVNGVRHQRKMDDKKPKIALEKTKLNCSIEANLNKIKTVSYITNIVITKESNPHAIINYKTCINYFSLMLLVNVDNKFKCLICNAQIEKCKWKQHIESKSHDTVLDEYLVVISKEHDNEFIRELQPGCFHCGYCNIQCDTWEVVEIHLKASVHRENKISSEWHLQQAAAHSFMENPSQQLSYTLFNRS